MILDKDGKQVTPTMTVHYSNVVTVNYEDGTTADLPITDLTSTLSSQDLINTLRRIRSPRQ